MVDYHHYHRWYDDAIDCCDSSTATGSPCLSVVGVGVGVCWRISWWSRLIKDQSERQMHERMVLGVFFSLVTIDLAAMGDRRISTDMWVWV